MKFLLISAGGGGCGLAMRIAEEGHDVCTTIQSEGSLHACDGLVPKVEQYGFEPDSETTVLFDCDGTGWLESLLLLHDHPNCGGGLLMDRLERDRAAGDLRRDADRARDLRRRLAGQELEVLGGDGAVARAELHRPALARGGQRLGVGACVGPARGWDRVGGGEPRAAWAVPSQRSKIHFNTRLFSP